MSDNSRWIGPQPIYHIAEERPVRKHNTTIPVMILGALMAGCAVTATPILTGDGKQRFFLDCGRQGTANCLLKANEVCPQGYAIDEDKAQTTWSFNRYGGGSSRTTTMVVTCK